MVTHTDASGNPKKKRTHLRKRGRPTKAELARKRAAQQSEAEQAAVEAQIQAEKDRITTAMQPDLAERIAGSSPEAVAQQKLGPLGNYDYIEQGSLEHAQFLGFDGHPGIVDTKDNSALDDVEMVFDLTGIKDSDVRRFKAERLRMLYGSPNQPPPPGCPERWDPDALPVPQ